MVSKKKKKKKSFKQVFRGPFMGPPGAPFRLGPGAKCPSCPPLWAALHAAAAAAAASRAALTGKRQVSVGGFSFDFFFTGIVRLYSILYL